MNLRRTTLVGAAGAAVLAPAAPADAVGPLTDRANAIDPVVHMAKRAHDRALDRSVRLHRANAELRGVEADRDHRAERRDWTTRHLRKSNARLRARNAELRREAATAPSTPAGGAAAPGNLEAIAACESGGDPTAVSSDGTYRGKYQFDYGTWASVGGSGDPAAAPEAEQDRRAAQLYAQSGSTPWPVCGS